MVSFSVNVWKCTGISQNTFVRGCFYNADSFFISLNCELSPTFPFSRLGFFSIITGFPPNVMTKIKSVGSATLLPVQRQISGEVMILNWYDPEKEKGLLWWPEEGAKDPIITDPPPGISQKNYPASQKMVSFEGKMIHKLIIAMTCLILPSTCVCLERSIFVSSHISYSPKAPCRFADVNRFVKRFWFRPNCSFTGVI